VLGINVVGRFCAVAIRDRDGAAFIAVLRGAWHAIVGGNSGPDGSFRFDNVLVGAFTVQARDPLTNLVGTVTGSIASDLQVVTIDVTLATWGALEGRVYRVDGVTPVAGATVSVTAPGVSFFDDRRHRTLCVQFLPLGAFSVTARAGHPRHGVSARCAVRPRRRSLARRRCGHKARSS
jgi:hypothetical protein